MNESEGTKLVMIAVDVQESIISEDITAQVVLATVSATAMSNGNTIYVNWVVHRATPCRY